MARDQVAKSCLRLMGRKKEMKKRKLRHNSTEKSHKEYQWSIYTCPRVCAWRCVCEVRYVCVCFLYIFVVYICVCVRSQTVSAPTVLAILENYASVASL